MNKKGEKLNLLVIFLGSLVLYLIVYRYVAFYNFLGIYKILPQNISLYVDQATIPFFSFLTGIVIAMVCKSRALTHSIIIGVIVHQLYLYTLSYAYPIINIYNPDSVFWFFILLLKIAGAAFVGSYIGLRFKQSDWS